MDTLNINDIARILKHATEYHGDDDKETKAVQACIEVLMYDFEEEMQKIDKDFDGERFLEACGIKKIRGY